MTALKPNAILLLRQIIPFHLNEMNTNSTSHLNDNENILIVAFTITHFRKMINLADTAQNTAHPIALAQPSNLLTNPIYKLTNYKRSNSYKTLYRITNQTSKNKRTRYMLTRDLTEFTKLHNTKLYGVRVSGDLTKRLTLTFNRGNFNSWKTSKREND